MAALNNPYRSIKEIYIHQERHEKRLQAICQLAQARGIPIETIDGPTFNRRFSCILHQGVVAHIEKLPAYHESDIATLINKKPDPSLILILDGVTDPHNLGACLRTADATGVDFIIIPKDKSASITPVVSKVASGAAESVPVVRVINLARSMKLLKECGIWIYGATEEASMSVYDLDARVPMALVMGAEGIGLRRLTREICDGLFSIPMKGAVSSLNVSVASGVCLYEVLRQRQSDTLC
jgi:23S rRNA (guanosine2251-2'-O)-methyltransferase